MGCWGSGFVGWCGSWVSWWWRYRSGSYGRGFGLGGSGGSGWRWGNICSRVIRSPW